MKVKRRDFLRGAAAASGAALLGRAAPSVGAGVLTDDKGLSSLPPPQRSGIEHIVVVMMENRSFDHYLGWLPNADGRQAGLTYLDGAGTAHPTHPLAPDFTGCSHPDPDHSYAGGRVQRDGGAMDGFLRSGANDEYAIGFYVEEDRPFYSALARNFTTFDRSFCSILGPTFPNRLFLHSAQTDRLSNTPAPAVMPTIWDRLAADGVSAKYYFSNLPFLGRWGAFPMCPSSTLGSRCRRTTARTMITRPPTSAAVTRSWPRRSTPSPTDRAGATPFSSSPTTSGVASSTML